MRIFILLIICISVKITSAQESIFSQDVSHSRSGDKYYHELPDPAKKEIREWQDLKNEINVSFANDNIRYPKEKVPAVSLQLNWKTIAWKGEKIHTQILVWTKKNIPAITLHVSDLISASGQRIPAKDIKASFVRYVMSDNFDGGCSHGPPTKYDSSLIEDPIDIIDEIPAEANTVRPVWLSIQVPVNIPAGNYSGVITINAISKFDLKISVNVLNYVLPPSSQWKYDFDIWQYPAPIARIHNVPLWSDEHFKLMRKYFTYLSTAGQKVITANIIEQPWGLDHTHFDDPTLIKWIKKKDGKWVFDFTLFDKFISLMMSCGIKQRINCYSMITWDLSFIYYDEALGKNNTITLKPGSAGYTSFWLPMIKEFTRHLKTKGWFTRTAIAMDERPVESMQAVIDLLRSVDPKWKVALAGDEYHPEIEKDIYDYSLASYLKVDDTVLTHRKAQGKPTTFYTACPEDHPNGHTFSPPAENVWLAWHAAEKGLTGYLFWAYNTWVANPLLDSRWRQYPAGDLFEFYPGPRTSIRFEKLIEGIQDFEKIRILREHFLAGKETENIKKLDKMLSSFEIENLKTISAADMLVNAKKMLNTF